MKSSIHITNEGNTIHATGSAAAELFDALTGKRVASLARHIHVNNGLDDNCKECGKDLRDEIHLRQGEAPCHEA
jgi:hypothetical protein